MGFFRKKEAKPPGPDYSHVDTREKAERLVERGKLVALLLLPEQFGGDWRAENIVFVPPFAADLKTRVDENIIIPLAIEGKVTRYRAEPEHAGRSMVPIAVKLVASDPADFTYNMAIWGDALGRESP
ncbi:hypothetical protein [Phenylobacterium sp.]|uniref:hypothetical protein n=1 Tax=Phenylobacterium sp. TaxID=1871053 RepID=UPI002735B361|nr:hypothetical protein [Phenylobacterium sp.]MDP3855986.1 hypothetical protein [Phenylobacterium sp.]